MADPTDSNDGGLLSWIKSKITDPSTGPATGTLPVGTGGRRRQQSVDDVVEQAAGGDSKLGRMKEAQSTDRDNSYNF